MSAEQKSEDELLAPIISAGAGRHFFPDSDNQLSQFIERALLEIMRVTKASSGNIYLLSEHDKLIPILSEYDDEESRAIARLALDSSGVIHLDFSEDDLAENRLQYTKTNNQIHYTRPTIAIRMELFENDLGVIMLHKDKINNSFYGPDLDLITSFATSFAILIYNSRYYKETSQLFINFSSALLFLLENLSLAKKLKETKQTVLTLLDVTNLINSSREFREMITAVLYSARKVIRAENASLFLVDEETGDLCMDLISGKESADLKGIRVPQGKGIVGTCAKEKRSLLVNDAQNDQRLYKKVDKISKKITRNLMAAPLVVNDITIGVIEVMNTLDRQTFSEDDLSVFESFSDSVAIALHRRRIQDRVVEINRELEQRLNDITCLHEVSGVLVDARDVDETFREIIKIISKHLMAERVSVLLYNQKTDQLELAMYESNTPYQNQVKITEYAKSISGYAFKNNKPLFVDDINKSDFADYANPGRYKNGSFIVYPLKLANGEKPFGVLSISEPKNGEFSKENFMLVSTISSQMVRGYENIKLTEESLAKQAIEKEVEITSRIQKNILPFKVPTHEQVQLSASSYMAKTTGGDFYDYFVHEENGDVTMLVADVSGKSLPAALFMAITSSIIRTIIRTEKEPARILGLANELIYEESQSGMFVTVFLARYEPYTGILRYASAGHNEMLLIHEDGSSELLSSHGLPLGVMPEQTNSFRGRTINIKKGDLLCLYTDGVIESYDENNNEYGLKRLIQYLQNNLQQSGDEMIEGIYKDVINFSGSDLQYDDFTMLTARFGETVPNCEEYSITYPAEVKSVPPFKDFLKAKCRRHGICGEVLDDFMLASDEAVTNIVKYAYRDMDVDSAEFRCNLKIETRKKLEITFIDQGCEFDINAVKQPNLKDNMDGKRQGGFGIYLIKTLMDNVSFVRKNDSNILYFEKAL